MNGGRATGREAGFTPRREAGFTLIELLIALALGLVVLAGVFSAFTAQDKAYRAQGEVTAMQEAVRAAAGMVANDVRMAGYGLPAANPGVWVTWVAMAANPDITDGGAGPDTLSVAAAFDAPVASLAAPAVAGATTLVLQPGEGSAFNTTDHSVLFLGRGQSAKVTAVVGDTLTVDTDPALPGAQGLAATYPAGAPVERVGVVTYRLAGTTLMRDANDGAGDQPVVDGIEDFQVTGGGAVTVSLTGRTRRPDPDYTDPVHGDGYRRLTYSPVVRPRNP